MLPEYRNFIHRFPRLHQECLLCYSYNMNGMVLKPTPHDQHFTSPETNPDHNEERYPHRSENTTNRYQRIIPNRRRFLATTAGIGLGTAFSAIGSNPVAGATTGDHLLQIRGTGSRATYRFTVSDNLQKSTAGGGTISDGDHITNQNRSASGLVRDGTDAYTFDGTSSRLTSMEK